MSQFFISYARADRKFASQLKRKLGALGHRVWLDDDSIPAGSNYQAEIDKAIRGSSAVIVVFSKSSINSSYVNYEWAYAFGARVTVVPLLLHKVELHQRFATVNHIDVSSKNVRRMSSVARALQKLEGRETIPAVASNAISAPMPHLVARFELDGERTPILCSKGVYALTLHVEAAPVATASVRFEVLDDTYRNPIWTSHKPNTKFSDDMTSYGDVMITAVGKRSGSKEPIWSIEDSLYQALQRGHPGRKSAAIRKALTAIKQN